MTLREMLSVLIGAPLRGVAWQRVSFLYECVNGGGIMPPRGAIGRSGRGGAKLRH